VSLAALSKTLGLAAGDALLAEALTHRSHGQPSYERLEFLGDRVLNLAIATWLHRLYPTLDEGALSIYHTALVRAECCATVAEGWGLWPLVKHKGLKNIPTVRQSVLADVTEALLAAVYLHSGMPAVQALVEATWAPLLHADVGHTKDAKTTLQEMLQAAGHPLPVYQVLTQTGPDHAAIFRVQVTCQLGQVQGQGPSKNAATMAAAANLLYSLNHERPNT
jgi:ribonuclease-3